MTKTTLSNLLCTIALSLLMASCLDRPFEDMTLEYYTRNFIKEFGLVDPEQDWNMAKACEVSVNVGDTKASSVKIYGLYGGTYYLCADLKDVKGKFKVPVDVPKSTTEFVVKVDGRSYTGNLNQTIDCTGDPTVESRDASGSALIDGSNIKINETNDYERTTWTHGTSGQEYEITATDYGTSTIKIGATKGDLLRKDRPAAVYGPNPAYQVINAQQVAPIISKVPWENYYSIGKGMTNYSGDKTRGFVPEGGVGDPNVDGDPGMNNSYGNTMNDGVSQDFTFDLEGDMFTVYPMFYGTNLVHILGFYLLDENNKPILDKNGKVMKFPIYKTKQNDDMIVRKYSNVLYAISVNEGDDYDKITVKKNQTQDLTIKLKNESGQDINTDVDYSKIKFLNPYSSYFTLTKSTDKIVLRGVAPCTEKPVTITYNGVSTSIYVTVPDPNVISRVNFDDLEENGESKKLTVELGTPKKLKIKFVNYDNEPITLTESEYNAALNTVRWQNETYISDIFDVYKEGNDIYVKGNKVGEQWNNFWIEGQGNASTNKFGLHVYVTDPFSDINLGIIDSNEVYVGDNGISMPSGTGSATLKLVNVTNKYSNPYQVDDLPEKAKGKITVETQPTHCTISSIGDDFTFTVTAGPTGGTDNIKFKLGSKEVTLKVKVTDPNALESIVILDSDDLEVDEVSSFNFTLSGSSVSPSSYKVYVKGVKFDSDRRELIGSERTITPTWQTGTNFTATDNGDGSVTITTNATSEVSDVLTLTAGGLSATLNVSVVDADRIVALEAYFYDGESNNVIFPTSYILYRDRQSVDIVVVGKKGDNSIVDLSDRFDDITFGLRHSWDSDYSKTQSQCHKIEADNAKHKFTVSSTNIDDAGKISYLRFTLDGVQSIVYEITNNAGNAPVSGKKANVGYTFKNNSANGGIKVRFITPKERRELAKKLAAERKQNVQKNSAKPRSRAEEAVPAKFQYDSTNDVLPLDNNGAPTNSGENNNWTRINKVWTKTGGTDSNPIGTVNSFEVNAEQMVVVKGFDVTITGKIPHKKIGLYIDVLDNPDITDKHDCYYTGLYRQADDSYPAITDANCPFPYTHFSQKGLNVYVADDRDHNHVESLVSGDNNNPNATKFEYSYAAAYKHPISDRLFFSFEDWRIKHPSTKDKDVTGLLSGYDYETKDFWGINNTGEKYTGDYSSDRDLNDLVFVMYGASKVNGTKDITTTTEDNFSWIWAVEDLGATDDFDFNDLVMRITSVTENIVVTETGGGIEGDNSDSSSLTFFKKVTFQPLCAGGTLPLYVHYGDYTLKPGEYVGEHIFEFFNGQNSQATVTKPYSDKASQLSDLFKPAESESEIHKWFGRGYAHTVMINTGSGPDVDESNIKSCVIYLCGEDFKSFTIADFGNDSEIKNTSTSNNKAGLYINVKDDRQDQYDDKNPIYDPNTGVATGDNAWSVNPPSEPGKVTQMFMLHEENWRWPKERRHILTAYPEFRTWVNSHKNGLQWYDYNALTEEQKGNCY